MGEVALSSIILGCLRQLRGGKGVADYKGYCRDYGEGVAAVGTFSAIKKTIKIKK